MRRVPCEQQLNMGQSVLRDGRTPFGREGDGLHCRRPIERESGSDPRTRSGGDERRKAPSAVTKKKPEKLTRAPGRVLFSLRRAGHPGMGSFRDRGPRPIKT